MGWKIVGSSLPCIVLCSGTILFSYNQKTPWNLTNYLPLAFPLFTMIYLTKTKTMKQQWHNFKDINSKPIINSVEFHKPFFTTNIFTFFLSQITTTNNAQNNRNIKLGTSSFFTLQFFIRQVVLLGCKSCCSCWIACCIIQYFFVFEVGVYLPFIFTTT